LCELINTQVAGITIHLQSTVASWRIWLSSCSY